MTFSRFPDRDTQGLNSEPLKLKSKEIIPAVTERQLAMLTVEQIVNAIGTTLEPGTYKITLERTDLDEH